jgi:hypothetical protein
VTLLAAVIVAAVAVGVARGGSLRAVVELPLRGRGLVFLAVAAQLAGALAALAGSRSGYDVGLGLSAAAAAAFCLRNLSVAGVPLVLAGLVANVTVIAANGAMPVSVTAAARAGVTTSTVAAGRDPRHDVSRVGTALPWLGDVIPVAVPVAPQVLSPGDVLVAAGLGQLVVIGCGRRRAPANAVRQA